MTSRYRRFRFRNREYVVDEANGLMLPALAGGSPMFNLDQSHFRFRNDDGTEITATWKQDQDVDETILVDTIFRVRFVLDELEAVAGTDDSRLQRDLNAAGFVVVSDTSAVIQAADSADAGVNDGDVTTDIIGGTGTFAAGEIMSSETTGSLETNTATSYAASGHSEHEVVIQVIGADVNDADTIDLRLVNKMDQLYDNYGQIPRITVNKPAGGAASLVIAKRRIPHLIGR